MADKKDDINRLIDSLKDASVSELTNLDESKSYFLLRNNALVKIINENKKPVIYDDKEQIVLKSITVNEKQFAIFERVSNIEDYEEKTKVPGDRRGSLTAGKPSKRNLTIDPLAKPLDKVREPEPISPPPSPPPPPPPPLPGAAKPSINTDPPFTAKVQAERYAALEDFITNSKGSKSYGYDVRYQDPERNWLFKNDPFNNQVRNALLEYYKKILQNPTEVNFIDIKNLLIHINENPKTQEEIEKNEKAVEIILSAENFPNEDYIKFFKTITDVELTNYFDVGTKNRNNYKWLDEDAIKGMNSIMKNDPNPLNFSGFIQNIGKYDSFKNQDQILEASLRAASLTSEKFKEGIRKFAFVEFLGNHYELSFLLNTKLFRMDLNSFGLDIMINYSHVGSSKELGLPMIKGDGGCLAHAIYFCLNNINIFELQKQPVPKPLLL